MDKVSPIGHNRQRLHPVDELAGIRQNVRALKAREAELREQIIKTKDFSGAEHQAWLKETSRETWDHKALKEEFGMAKLRPFVKRVAITMLKVEGADDGE